MAAVQPAPVAAPPGLTPAAPPPADPVAVGVFVYPPTDPGSNGSVHPSGAVAELVAAALRDGRPVACVPTDAVVSSSFATAFLGVSFFDLRQMLDDGTLPAAGYGVRFADLLAYRQRERARRRAAMDELCRIHAEMEGEG